MRHEVYRVAFDEASAELSDILTKFEMLRLRKDRIEKVVEALKPLIVQAETAAIATPSLRAERVQPPMMASVTDHAVAAVVPTPDVPPVPSPIPYPVQQAVEESNDPFSRRAENSLGLGSAARDVREYSRLFSTGNGR